jgi:hypothetical protein
MRKKSFAIGHMYYAHPTSSEHYYLQMLLNCVKGATSYEHLRTVDGIEHDTFKDACIAMGLLVDEMASSLGRSRSLGLRMIVA